MQTRPVAVTAGEPAGIGPDICLSLATHHSPIPFVVIGDAEMLAERAEKLNTSVKIQIVSHPSEVSAKSSGVLSVLPVSVRQHVTPGQLDPANAEYVLETLRVAAQGCLDGDFSAMVTAPVHKGVINEAGISFSGHTEFLAELADIQKVVMMLATPRLRVALVTTHLPLRAVSDAITRPVLNETLQIIHRDLQQHFGIEKPRIAVCGLNPHAGEDGYLGDEEITTIRPVIAACQQQGLNISGPWPADTVFVADRLLDYDVVLAMYHDQGLPVLKHDGFGEAVNITLGLPFIRTSVDHGTALDLAGSGRAEAGSLLTAFEMASTMHAARQSP